MLLRAGDIHHCQTGAGGRDFTRNPQCKAAHAGLQHQFAATQCGRCKLAAFKLLGLTQVRARFIAEKDVVRLQRRETCVRSSRIRARQQHGLHAGQTKQVHAVDLQRILAPRQARLNHQHRAGFGHFGARGQHRVDGFVKTIARPHQLQIGFASDQAHAAPELIDGSAVDELHCQAQRHPERDRE